MTFILGGTILYIEIKDVKKSYGEGSARVDVLKGISTQIDKGQMCVILGPSGSGKSTFLNLIGGLDSADSGKIIIDGMNIASMKNKRLADYRRDSLGFIFQFYNLIPNLTVYENIQVCENLTSSPMNIDELLDVLNMTEHKNKFPSQLSGGQQQRCAIARALVKNPKLLLCDEPTGALDSKTSKEILILLEKVNKIYNTTMLIVTHNTAIKDMVHKVIKIKDGLISKDYNNTELISAENIEW
jgi:putative ABC transport system ATP-binding protein